MRQIDFSFRPSRNRIAPTNGSCQFQHRYWVFKKRKEILSLEMGFLTGFNDRVIPVSAQL